MKHAIIFLTLLLLSMPVVTSAMDKEKQVKECACVCPFVADTTKIDVIRKHMDDIESRNLDYKDYSRRKGIIWSDVLLKVYFDRVAIVKEYDTEKVTRVEETYDPEERKPQSIMDYPALCDIFCQDILPRMLDTIRKWKPEIPETINANLFLQRSDTSDSMPWHQDLGEDYDPQDDYSAVLLLSKQDDPSNGWEGGVFQIRAGLPTDSYDENNVQKIIPQYNQAIIFNNQINSHAVTPVTKKEGCIAKRDLAIAGICFGELSRKKK